MQAEVRSRESEVTDVQAITSLYTTYPVRLYLFNDGLILTRYSMLRQMAKPGVWVGALLGGGAIGGGIGGALDGVLEEAGLGKGEFAHHDATILRLATASLNSPTFQNLKLSRTKVLHMSDLQSVKISENSLDIRARVLLTPCFLGKKIKLTIFASSLATARAWATNIERSLP